LYLARYYRCEKIIADDLLCRSRGILPVDMENAASLIARLFPAGAGEDYQRMAVAAAALKQFVVISGGPGTGKTYTVARILALLQALAGAGLRIGLAAPTGKAAVRLQESIGTARKTLDDDLAAMVPAETKTLHRLLGYNPGTGQFRHNSRNRLHLDLLVIDEASMIDVPLMAALVEALPEKTRVVMLGDRDQLTSVEAGSLFGDICSSPDPGWSAELCARVERLAGWAPQPVCPGENFGDSVVLLRKSYRFQGKGGISGLAAVINSGSRDQLLKMYGREYDDLLLGHPDENRSRQRLEEYLLAGFKPCFASREPAEALTVLAGFRILCALREGPHGVAGVNLLTENILRRQGLLSGSDQWYRGRPLIIRSNHYGLQLFNGDTGVVWPDKAGKLRAWFARPDGSLHQVPLSRLPEHDTAYAITVHQSQGSEFAEVLFLLPTTDNRVLCRELIYTGITRARERLLLHGAPDLLATAMERSVVRYSGLNEKLWKRDKERCS
ncbi:MAG TPA: exodeoxyribonuclease V subunit alpha, partial [Desulfobacteraceae bacterium]|nr:exodeoxyribonuclease V subunit alpha [Desulfobacteraceae bacterium]